ncbi:MAG: NADH-quinone oxidoreductase subunit C [Chloroflexi bacterium]|nr:NADH-quinone oxidoreductase subunit C [Chloroflexota bacterium]
MVVRNRGGDVSSTLVIQGIGKVVSVREHELHDAALVLASEGFSLDMIVPVSDPLDGIYATYVLGRQDGARAAILATISGAARAFPSLVAIWPEADWPERRARDLFGISITGNPRDGRLVRHANWPSGYRPMVDERAPADWPSENGLTMDLVPVAGEGVHEIPVGPIHAGIIEPGHFRFYVDGERIVGLELKLFYTHRGIEKAMEGRPISDGIALAETVSGDSAVAHSWAYCAAVERALGITVSEEALALRGFLLELERVACHVGDVGAIMNDIAYNWIFTQCQGVREDLLRAYDRYLGHRFLRGIIGVGGVRAAPSDLDPVLEALVSAAGQATDLLRIALERASVIGRLRGTGELTRKEALARHAVGVVGRASGLALDCRATMGSPYTEAFETVIEGSGDVEARVLVRLKEIEVSVELAQEFIGTARSARAVSKPTEGRMSGVGIGFAEGWRGECLHYIDIKEGRVARWAPRDPSSLNWPLLPAAVEGDLVPDFPLINKSFNLSYAGNDL